MSVEKIIDSELLKITETFKEIFIGEGARINHDLQAQYDLQLVLQSAQICDNIIVNPRNYEDGINLFDDILKLYDDISNYMNHGVKFPRSLSELKIIEGDNIATDIYKACVNKPWFNNLITLADIEPIQNTNGVKMGHVGNAPVVVDGKLVQGRVISPTIKGIDYNRALAEVYCNLRDILNGLIIYQKDQQTTNVVETSDMSK